MFTKSLLCAGLQAGVEPNEAPVLEELPVKKSFQKDRAGGCSVLLGLSMMGGVLDEPGWGRTTGNASFLPSFFPFLLLVPTPHTRHQESHQSETWEQSAAPGSASHWLVTLVKYPPCGSSLRIVVGSLSPTSPYTCPRAGHQRRMGVPGSFPLSCPWPSLGEKATHSLDPLPRDLWLCPRAAPPWERSFQKR